MDGMKMKHKNQVNLGVIAKGYVLFALLGFATIISFYMISFIKNMGLLIGVSCFYGIALWNVVLLTLQKLQKEFHG